MCVKKINCQILMISPAIILMYNSVFHSLLPLFLEYINNLLNILLFRFLYSPAFEIQLCKIYFQSHCFMCCCPKHCKSLSLEVRFKAPHDLVSDSFSWVHKGRPRIYAGRHRQVQEKLLKIPILPIAIDWTRLHSHSHLLI